MAVVLVLIALRTPVAFALGATALLCMYLYFALPRTGGVRLEMAVRPAMTLATTAVYELFYNYSLTAIPMFIALGHVCYRAGITSEIYYAARAWLTRVPGGLAMASVLGCGGFAAISGSSLACAATMGRVAVPEMLRYGYSDRLATGSVAAGGTLGALIPPGIVFIIYGVFAEQSISALFIAAIIPGLLSMLGYWIVIAIWTTWRRQDAPRGEEAYPLAQRLRVLAGSWPAAVIFVIIVGGIYGGVFTATEAAAVSFVTATVVALATRRLRLRHLGSALWETTVQSAAIFLIAAAAKLFASFVSLTGMANEVVALVQAANPGTTALLIGIVLVYLVLGMFLDPLGIMLLTLPFVLPLIEGRGLDLIWFGVVVVKLLEMGLITPPVGLNVFVINGVTQPPVPVMRIFAGVLPFFAMDVAVLSLLLAIPALTLALPAAL
ncbi:TRAP transporter large permease [Tistlia consotensis]|nr:TRAP transporter large permease [Tistlia consotensis]